jgi:hypothetical protein
MDGIILVEVATEVNGSKEWETLNEDFVDIASAVLYAVRMYGNDVEMRMSCRDMFGVQSLEISQGWIEALKDGAMAVLNTQRMMLEEETGDPSM